MSLCKCESASDAPQIRIRKFQSAYVAPEKSLRECFSANAKPKILLRKSKFRNGIPHVTRSFKLKSNFSNCRQTINNFKFCQMSLQLSKRKLFYQSTTGS